MTEASELRFQTMAQLERLPSTSLPAPNNVRKHRKKPRGSSQTGGRITTGSRQTPEKVEQGREKRRFLEKSYNANIGRAW